jgi:murein DD-endopeptidase MepM/ murein hydrolase activator NlpD
MISKTLASKAAALAAALLCTAMSTSAFADASPTPSGSPTASASASASPRPSPTPTSKVEQDRAALASGDAQFNTMLQKTDKLRAASTQALAKIDDDLALAQQRLQDAQKRQKAALAALVVADANLTTAKATLKAATDVLNARATSLYIIGPSGYVNALLSATDINEVMMADAYGRSVLGADIDAVTRFRAAEERVRHIEEQARALKREIDNEVSSSMLITQALEDLRNRQQSIQSELFGNMKDNVALLSALLNSSNPFAAVLAAFSDTSGGFAKLIRDEQQGQPPAQFQQHYLKRPVPGEVTQGFGWRIHPVFGYLSFHTGVDLAASYGDPVYAAQAGKVIDTGYFGPFGLTVLIDHGGSIATTYSHLSEIDVAPGDIVTINTVIGKIGTTGWSTGPHLHFEVHIDGDPVEPTRWF